MKKIDFSLVVKATVVLLTFIGLPSLWTAIAADMGASYWSWQMACDCSASARLQSQWQEVTALIELTVD